MDDSLKNCYTEIYKQLNACKQLAESKKNKAQLCRLNQLIEQTEQEISTTLAKSQAMVESLASTNVHSAELLDELNQEAIRANELKSQFLANITHELRTPLNIIIGYGQLILDDFSDGINEGGEIEIIKDIKKIVKSGNSMLLLVENIITIANFENEKTGLVIEKISVVDLCNELMTIFNNIINKKQLTLTVEYDAPELLLSCDIHKLKQAILNLLRNAEKFSLEKKKILLKVCCLEQGNIKFIVKDQGIGVDLNDKELIFQPFFKSKRDDGKISDGLGLGLTIAEKMVSSMGGRIYVESNQDEGSQFIIELPHSVIKEEEK